MVITGRTLLLWLLIAIVVVGVSLWMVPGARWLALVAAACGLGGIAVLLVVSPRGRALGPTEPDDIDKLSEARRRELMRGTSLYLRERSYRYSVRLPGEDLGERHCFTAEVNTIRLGFIPAVIIDNTNDRQGYGYVAFVYDGHRWRGPGLPCPDGQEEAVRHAARCVSPLATDEETTY
ncbi:MAG: hypothetical protein ACYTGG_01645 [Planctomycetota bacterium]|jgi:hypothetical protein